MSKRMAFFVDEVFMTPEGIVPGVCTEDEPGFGLALGNGEFASPWYWGMDIATAQVVCDDANARMGLTPKEAQEIVTSSIRAQNTQEAMHEQFERRWREVQKGARR